jgi:hypothetical protein
MTATDISSFTSAPERILHVGGHWFVVTNEGTRRAAVIGPNGRIAREIGPSATASSRARTARRSSP